jgi:hypothetical protein
MVGLSGLPRPKQSCRFVEDEKRFDNLGAAGQKGSALRPKTGRSARSLRVKE